jgi:hypothetical protein
MPSTLKAYSSPGLTVYGDIATLTLEHDGPPFGKVSTGEDNFGHRSLATGECPTNPKSGCVPG